MSFPATSIRAIDLTDEEKAELSSQLAGAYKSLRLAAIENYNTPRIKRMRDDFKSGKITLRYNAAARRAMLLVMSLESRVLSAYIKMCNELCAAFHHSHLELQGSIGYSDYLQEAAWAIYDAAYTYNGSTEFSTYCFWCVKNQLISYIRKHRAGVGVTKKLAALRTLLRKLMRESELSMDDAIIRLIAESKMSAKDEKSLRRVMSKNCNIDEEYDVPDSAKVDEETALMWNALEKTELSPLERELVEGHLKKQKELRRIISETRINPNTGNLYTKAVLSTVFLGACAKLRATFEVLKKAA